MKQLLQKNLLALNYNHHHGRYDENVKHKKMVKVTGSATASPRTVASWITPLLIHYPSVTILYEAHESFDGNTWRNCNTGIPVRYIKRSLDLSCSEIPPRIEATSCGASGTCVFWCGVYHVDPSFADRSIENKFFKCVNSGYNQKVWYEVTINWIWQVIFSFQPLLV